MWGKPMRDKSIGHFSDLEAQGVLKALEKQQKVGVKMLGDVSSNIKRYKAGEGRDILLKDSPNTQAIAGVASSKMYNSIGIETPPIYMLKSKGPYTSTVQQDVLTIEDVLSTLAGDDLEYASIEKKVLGKFKWQIFYDSNMIRMFLEFMTPECLEQLKNVFLVDELRTDYDRHVKNYFFYKSKNSDKYEGVIVIDPEQMIIYKYCGTKKEEFDSFLLYPYSSATPQQVVDIACYRQRVNDIREMIQDGVLSKQNIEVLLGALKYDFPAEIKQACRQRKLKRSERNKIITPAQRLWEYNQKTIGKELEM